MWWEPVAQFITSFEWQQENDRLFIQFNIDNLTVEGEGGDTSGEPSHTVDLTDQAAEAMAAYRDHIAGLMLAKNKHHWCRVILFLFFGRNWFLGIDASMPCSKLFSYWLSFIILDNCHSFSLTHMIKVLGLNVIYKTIDL